MMLFLQFSGSLHDGCRVWKTLDWDTMDRLHQKGLISNPARADRKVGQPPSGAEGAGIFATCR